MKTQAQFTLEGLKMATDKTALERRQSDIISRALSQVASLIMSQISQMNISGKREIAQDYLSE